MQRDDTKITYMYGYNNEYALLEMENDGGVTFVTLIDKDGNWAFEPIKGAVYTYDTAPIFNKELNQYVLMDGEDLVFIDETGEVYREHNQGNDCNPKVWAKDNDEIIFYYSAVGDNTTLYSVTIK